MSDPITSDCIADLKLREQIWIDYPGASSLEFQDIIRCVVETLFNWDSKKKQAKEPGIFGTVAAFTPEDEEQGQKTVHRHIQL